MKAIKLTLFILIIGACSCKSKLTGKELMPDMMQTDSVEILFFKSPENQRFYTYLPVKDKEFIHDLVTDVSGEVQPENPCIKEGKIYCFKNGQIFNTIFFAYTDPECSLLRYIKNGNLYYFPIGETTKKKLIEYKKAAWEPVSADSSAQNH
jgi:hypothetical protein